MLAYFLVSIVLSQDTCPEYTCSQGSTVGECQSYSQSGGISTYKFTACEFPYACAYTFNSSVNCTNSFLDSRYVGELCSSTSECTSSQYGKGGYCSTVCMQGSYCNSTADCQRNTYCLNSSCVRAIPIGAACSATFQCTLGSYCDNKICVLGLSKYIGTTTNLIMTPNFAPTCITGFALPNKIGNFTCSDAPMSNSTSPIPCQIGSRCYARDGINYKMCMCGYNGQGYCPLFEGDIYVLFMFQESHDFTIYFGCNNLRPFTYNCLATVNQPEYLETLLWASLYFDNNWVYQNNNSQCINQTAMSGFNNILTQIQEYENGRLHEQCPLYFDVPSIGTNSSQCANIIDDIYDSIRNTYYEILPCENSSDYCNLGDSTGYCSSMSTTRYAGEYCKFNSDCVSGTCKENLCFGNTLGQKCTFGSCNLGLYCNSNTQKCTELPQEGDTCGYSNGEAVCDTYLACNLTVCRSIFSISDDKHVQCQSLDYSPHINVLCKSGYSMILLEWGVPVCKCYGEVEFDYNVPAMCTDQFDNCPVYTASKSNMLNSVLTNTTSCECGLDGNYYCPSTIFDYHYASVKEYLLRLKSTGTKCNGDLSYDEGCYAYDEKVLAAFFYFSTNQSYVQWSPILRSNNFDTISVINATYAYQIRMISQLPKPISGYGNFFNAFFVILTTFLIS